MTEWISVRSRLPKDDEDVLVYVPEREAFHGLKPAYITGAHLDADDWFLICGCEPWRVTHWMPMPSAPSDI